MEGSVYSAQVSRKYTVVKTTDSQDGTSIMIQTVFGSSFNQRHVRSVGIHYLNCYEEKQLLTILS